MRELVTGATAYSERIGDLHAPSVAGEATRSFGALGSIEITRGSSRSGNTTYTQTGNSRHDLNGRMVPSRARSVLPQTATAAAAAPMSR